MGELFSEVEPEDLIKFGLIPELVGRLPVVATLDELDEAALIQILTEPKNALLKQFQKLFAMEGAELDVRPTALTAIARRRAQAQDRRARPAPIIEQALLDTMYDLPSQGNVKRVVLDENVIEGDGKPC